MRSSIVFGLVFLSIISVRAQIPALTWVKNTGSLGANIKPNATATDGSGNVYITGEFSGTTDFDPGSGTFQLTAIDDDAFVLKLDANGNFVWARRVGSALPDAGRAISIDGAGNVLVTGSFNDIVDFDPGTGTFELSSFGLDDLFILKLTSAGNFVFARQIGGSDFDYVTAVTTDGNNRIFVTGSFSGTCNFDPGVSDTELTANGSTDGFLAKFDANGNFAWANQFDWAGGEDIVEAMNVDLSGNPHIAGEFEDAGSHVIFVKKLDGDGIEIWGHEYGNTYGNSAKSIQLNASGDVFFSGSLKGTADFDPSGSGFTLTGPDAYVCRLTSSGSFTWAIQMGHDSNAGLGAMAIDANSNIFIIGSYGSNIDLDPGPGVAMLYSVSSDFGGSFLQKLTASGDYVWGQSILTSTFNASEFAALAALAIDNAGRLVVTGSFSETAVFSTGVCVNGTTTAASESDLFAMRLQVDAGPPTCFGAVLDPLSTTICKESSVMLIAYGAGAPRVTYQWQRFNGTSFVDIADQGADEESGDEGYEGTNLPFLTITSISDSGTGDFRCVISGEGVSDAFSATATLTYLPSSAIPYVVANSGCGPGRYMITAYGQTDGNYKWYDSNGTEIPGEVNSTFTTPSISSPTKFSVAKGLGVCFSKPASVLVNTQACADPPGLVWAAQPQTTSGSVTISRMVIDATGNIYATGSFNGTVDFDSGPGITSLTATASTEYFLLKMKDDQSLVWVKALGALSSVFPSLSGNGSLYLTGSFRGTIDFDPNAAVVSLTATGNLAMYVTKFDTDGNLTWAKMIAGAAASVVVNPRSIASDANGVYTTGTLTGSADFDPNATTLTLSASTVFSDIFICKLDPNGALNGGVGFAYRIGNTSATDAGRAIGVDAAGNIYSVGTFFGTTTDFNPGAGSTVLAGGGATDFYMHKLSNTGVFQWARNIGGAGVEIPFDIAVDATGNSFITGTFGTIITNQTVDFDPGAGVANLVSNQGILFALKLDADGNYTWAKNFGGTFGAEPNDIALDASGHVLITGHAGNNVDFDPGTTTYRLPTNVDQDAFLSQLDASGNFMWAYNLQSTGETYYFNEGLSVATYTDGSIFLSGRLTHSSDMDPGPCTYALLRSAGNAFIQKVKPGVVTMCFNLQPDAVAGCEGTDATLSTLAAGTTNITYQWQKLNTATSVYEDLTDTGVYQGTTTADLTITTAGAIGNGDYRCIVSGDLVADLTTNVADINITTDNPPSTVDATGCPATGITLKASGGAAGQYRWYEDDLSTQVPSQISDTFTTPPLTTSRTYYVSIVTGVCESSLTPVEATVQDVTTPTTIGGSNCGPGVVSLQASGGTNGSYRWYDVSIGGTAITGAVNDSYVSPVLTTSETYYATLFDGTCESLRVPVNASIFAVPTKPIISNTGAVTFCSGGSVTLGLPTSTSYLWSSGETTQQISVTSPGTFTATVKDANGCTSEVSDPLVVAVFPLPTKPTVSASGALVFCEGGSVTLSTASASTYSWSGGQTSQQLSVTTSGSYVVTITDGNGCPSPPSDAINVTVNAPPAKPIVDSGGLTSFCSGQSITLSAPTGYTYTWSTGATTRQIVVTTAGSYSVLITDANLCSSVVSDAVVLTVNNCNQPPVISTTSAQTEVNGSVSISLAALLSDPDNNIDFTTLSVFEQPTSGASAFVNADLELVIDYTGISFSGTDEITIEVCDDQGACTQQKIFIEVFGEVVIVNGISPNGDGINDFFQLKFIESIEETRSNRVTIYNRWGDEVFAVTNYDNKTNVFRGQNKNGNDLPSGTYLYKIDFAGNYPQQTGYLVIKR